MVDDEPKPEGSRSLKTVPLENSLGDLSGMQPEERAELVLQQAQFEEMQRLIRAEAEVWRKMFWIAGAWIAGWLLLLIPAWLVDSRSSLVTWLWEGPAEEVIVIVCWAGAFVGVFLIVVLFLPMIITVIAVLQVIWRRWRRGGGAPRSKEAG